VRAAVARVLCHEGDRRLGGLADESYGDQGIARNGHSTPPRTIGFVAPSSAAITNTRPRARWSKQVVGLLLPILQRAEQKQIGRDRAGDNPEVSLGLSANSAPRPQVAQPTLLLLAAASASLRS
jgi:hypothetical protein